MSSPAAGQERKALLGLRQFDDFQLRALSLSRLGHRLAIGQIDQVAYPPEDEMLPILNKQGNALLTNQAIQSRRFHYLNNGVKRLVIEIELEDANIFLVHLSLRYRKRQDQLGDLFQLIDAARKPVIVAGDFNVFRGARELELFKAAAGLESANFEGEPSHPSRAPKRQLDYILHSRDIHVSRFFVPQVTFSDHVPLVCDFEVLRADEKKIVPPISIQAAEAITAHLATPVP